MKNLDDIVKIYIEVVQNSKDEHYLEESPFQALVGCKIINIIRDHPELNGYRLDDNIVSFIIITECEQVFILEYLGYFDSVRTLFWKYEDNSKLEDK
jgi:hypothetical protein